MEDWSRATQLHSQKVLVGKRTLLASCFTQTEGGGNGFLKLRDSRCLQDEDFLFFFSSSVCFSAAVILQAGINLGSVVIQPEN